MRSIKSIQVKYYKSLKIKSIYVLLITILFPFLSLKVLASTSSTGGKKFPFEAIIKDTIVSIKLGEFQEAIFELEEIKEEFKSNPAIYFYLGKAYSGMKNNNEAIINYQKAIKADPKYPKPYVALALIKGKEQKMNEALTFLDKAINADPNYADSYANRGVVKGALGDPTGARKDFSKSIELNPLLVNSYINRGISYEISGNINQACLDWQTAKNLGNSKANSWINDQCKNNYDTKLFRQLRLIKSLENKNKQLEKKLTNLSKKVNTFDTIKTEAGESLNSNKISLSLEPNLSIIDNQRQLNENELIINENLFYTLISFLIISIVLLYVFPIRFFMNNNSQGNILNQNSSSIAKFNDSSRNDIIEIRRIFEKYIENIIYSFKIILQKIHRYYSNISLKIKIFFKDNLNLNTPLVNTELVNETPFEVTNKTTRKKSLIQKLMIFNKSK